MSGQKRQKIYPYILQNKTKNKMIELIDRSIKTKAEYGFKLCLNERDKNIRSGTPCKGKYGLDTTTSQCKENEKPVGIFHTQRYMSTLSIQDLHDIHSNLISCIGNYEEIKCFKRKKEYFDSSEYDEIRHAENLKSLVELEHKRYHAHEITYTEYREKETKYEKEMDRLINSYFDIVSIKK